MKIETFRYPNSLYPTIVRIVDGIVVESTTEFCVVGQKPNRDFLRRCGWKRDRSELKRRVTDVFGTVTWK